MEASTVRVPSRIVSAYPKGSVKIWLWARFLDKAGSGMCEGSIDSAAALLKVSQRTVRRWLADGCRLGLIRHYRTQDGIARIFYSSLQKVALNAKLVELGPIAEVPVEEIEKISIVATEIEAQALQSASFYAASRVEKRQRNSKKVVEVRHLFDLPEHPSGFGSGVICSGKRFLYVTEDFVCYGGSQSKAAELRGCSEKTVQRHLSNSYRSAVSSDLHPIRKLQLAQRLPSWTSWRSVSSVEDSSGGHLRRLGRIFHLKTNIYESLQVIIPSRNTKKKYKRMSATAKQAPPTQR